MDTNNIKNLNNIDINKSYSGGNKLIHLIILQNNNKLLQKYLDKKYDINLTDSYNNTPYHLLLSQVFNLDTFKKIINHKVCWNNKNNNNISILDLILTNNTIFSQLDKFHKYFMVKDILDANPNNYINICKNLSPQNIIKYSHIINFQTTLNDPPLFQLINNPLIKSISSIIKKLDYKKLINIKNDMGDNLIGKFILIHKNNINKNNKLEDLLQLVKLGFSPNYQNPITGSQPFKLLLIYVNDKTFLLDYFNNNKINPNIIDNFGNNLALFILFLYHKKNWKQDKLLTTILNKSDPSHKNLNGQSINNILNPNYKGNYSENNIKLIDIQPVNSTQFRARLDDIIFYFMTLENKHKNLHIPKFNKNISSKNLDFNFNLLSLPTELPLTLDDLPFFISFIDQNTYYVHPYLNLIINNLASTHKNDYSIVFLSIQDEENNLHANILFYDFKNKTITRFEPYGDTTVLDKNLDDIIEEELTWNTTFKYIKPSDYIEGSGLQSLSDENNIANQKPGDFGGFCLAWCLWFVEMKLNNSNISNKDLIQKSIKKIIKKHSLVDYIRSYGDKITKDKYKIYKQIKIPQNIWSNINFDTNSNKIIFDEIIKYLN